MVQRVSLVLISIIFQSFVFSQTIVWDEKKMKGSILFDNDEVTLLVVGFFEKMDESSQAANIYNKNLIKFQNELLEILEKSDVNSQLIFRHQFDDSTYSDLEKYPVIIDHGVHMRQSENGGLVSFLHLWVIDRSTNFNARMRLKIEPSTNATNEFTRVFRKLFRKIKRGKPIRIYQKK